MSCHARLVATPLAQPSNCLRLTPREMPGQPEAWSVGPLAQSIGCSGKETCNVCLSIFSPDEIPTRHHSTRCADWRDCAGVCIYCSDHYRRALLKNVLFRGQSGHGWRKLNCSLLARRTLNANRRTAPNPKLGTIVVSGLGHYVAQYLVEPTEEGPA